VALQILQTMFPTIRIWHRDSSSMVIRTIHDILSSAPSILGIAWGTAGEYVEYMAMDQYLYIPFFGE
jgi:hypothetical protein